MAGSWPKARERRREGIRSKSSGDQEQSAAEHPKRSARMTADGGPAGGGRRSPAPAGRAQAARPSAAPCRARRSGGRGGRSSATPPAVAGEHALDLRGHRVPGNGRVAEPATDGASGGLGVPVAFLSNRRDKPAARGNHRRTRQQQRHHRPRSGAGPGRHRQPGRPRGYASERRRRERGAVHVPTLAGMATDYVPDAMPGRSTDRSSCFSRTTVAKSGS